jgi:hypothetical protein
MIDETEVLEPSNKPVRKPAKSQPKRDSIGGAIKGSRLSYKERNLINVQDQDPNFVYRWINYDNDRYSGRVDKMRQIGYTVVHDDMEFGDERGVDASQIGGSNIKHVGSGTKAVLMRIPKEYYEEDKAEKQAEVDRTERGMVEDEQLKGKGMYGEGLKITK